jgi:RNA binding exosome subunit
MANSRLPVAHATVRAFAHATEDVERVRQCIHAIAGDGVSLAETGSRGYHHQPLRVLEAVVRGSRNLRDLLARMGTPEILEDYQATWERRLDIEGGVLHFRLAKQPLLEGLVELEPAGGEGDLVKMELKLLAYPAKPESYREVARSIFDLAGGGTGR